ncbi:hypothetical protein ACW7EJ_20250, partial [Acinetobacter soli]
KLTRGQKVELVVNAEDTNGLASSDYGHEFLPPLTFYLPPNAMFAPWHISTLTVRAIQVMALFSALGG